MQNIIFCLFAGSNGLKVSREECKGSVMSMACSPPYKRVRALRLFDTPATPKTLIEKSAATTPVPAKCTRLFSSDKPRSVSSLHGKLDKPSANVNPFTPNGMMLTARKRTRSKRSLNRYDDLFWFIRNCYKKNKIFFWSKTLFYQYFSKILYKMSIVV